ncbi:MAG: hypothetical protein Q7W02_10735 [Candidatus Rokubacteria bacterium]|nr:hypothetical protein [Candidatus Rokubacteria bacterium]
MSNRRAQLLGLFTGYLLLSVLVMACSRSGDITGTIFVTMKSGDVKRGADVEVVLIARSEKFDQEWTRLKKESREESSKAQAGYDAAYQAYSSLRYDSGFLKSYGDNWAAWAARLSEVRATYLARARPILAAAVAKSTRTDVNGTYAFRTVPRGKYYLYAEYKVFDNELSWLVPVEITGEEQKMDLSNSNSGALLSTR